jgi:hypothetical protein
VRIEVKKLLLIAMTAAGLAGGPARAADVSLSGFLDDPGNAALVWSDLGPALFGDDWEIANNVALYELVVPVDGPVRFDSNGFAAGGADPYFTLFAGSGPAATFVHSNYDQAFCCGGDFLENVVLGAGTYTIAMGAFANMSFAENLGAGTLGDGFIQLGVPEYLGNYYYELGVSFEELPPPVAEPASLVMSVLGLLALGVTRRRTRS